MGVVLKGSRFQWRHKAEFVYPIPPAPRTAVLVPCFRSRGGVKVFKEGWCERAAKFAPEAIAATLGQLEAIAATGIAVTHAIVVVGRLDDARVREADREMLWNRFRVPVFEQVVDEGKVVAFECETHYGLHIESGEIRSRLGEGRIEETQCGCGHASPRWISKEEMEREENLRSIASYAR